MSVCLSLCVCVCACCIFTQTCLHALPQSTLPNIQSGIQRVCTLADALGAVCTMHNRLLCLSSILSICYLAVASSAYMHAQPCCHHMLPLNCLYDEHASYSAATRQMFHCNHTDKANPLHRKASVASSLSLLFLWTASSTRISHDVPHSQLLGPQGTPVRGVCSHIACHTQLHMLQGYRSHSRQSFKKYVTSYAC